MDDTNNCILSLTSFWLLYPLLFSSINNKTVYIIIHTIFTSLISALYWYNGIPDSLYHKLDKINARLYYLHLLFYKNNTILIYYLFLMTLIFYGFSLLFGFKDNNKNTLFAHLVFRKIGFYIVSLKIIDNLSLEHLVFLTVSYYCYIFIILYNEYNFNNYIYLVIFKFFIIYVSSNVYPNLR